MATCYLLLKWWIQTLQKLSNSPIQCTVALGTVGGAAWPWRRLPQIGPLAPGRVITETECIHYPLALLPGRSS